MKSKSTAKHSEHGTKAKTIKKSAKSDSRTLDPCHTNHSTTVPTMAPTYTYNSKSHHSNSNTVAVSIPAAIPGAGEARDSSNRTTGRDSSYAANVSSSTASSSAHHHSSHSSGHASSPGRSKHSSSSSKSSRKQQSSHSQHHHHHHTSSNVVKSQSHTQFKSLILGLAVACALAFAFLSSQNRSPSPANSSSQQRYIRSVSPQSSSGSNSGLEEEATILTRVQNGVTEMYNTHFKNTVQNVLGSVGLGDAGSSLAAGSAGSKNGKLHYIPSSAYDPTKTAHHVLEGAGYRLNIPSYVQSVPSVGQPGSDGPENAQANSELSEVNSYRSDSPTEEEAVSVDDASSQIAQNEKFDQAILAKQIIAPRSFASAPSAQQPLTENGIVKQAIFNPNDVPISSVDPVLDNIIQEMLAKHQEQSSSFQAVRKPNTTEIFSKDSDLGQCLPSNNVVFAKTHKTGGTTITNMLLRHAEKQKLNVALPVEYHWELAGYPAQFEEKLITPKQEQYDVMCHHMRFNKTKIEKMVNPLADYFTILRDPVTNFESSFGFFKDYPFTDWLDENRNLDDFVDNAGQYYNKSTPWYFRAKNYMSFDLGFDHENNTDAYIRHAIAKMEEDFKFVMITDRYEESMILLKNMLCLDYDDIVYLPLKVRTDNDRKRISSETAAKIKKWNRLDTAIYEYFAQRFEQMTVDYGKDKLAREVQILREKLKDVEARCVEDYDSQSLKPWIKRIKLRKPSGQKCQRLVWGEVKYADYLRQLQYSQLSDEEYNDQPALDEKIELMQQVQKTVLGDPTV